MSDVQCAADAPVTRHVATFTTIKSTNQVLVRVQGPNAPAAEGHEVPVTRKGGGTETVKLTKLVFVGVDDKEFPDHPATGQPVALYEFERIRSNEPFVF